MAKSKKKKKPQSRFNARKLAKAKPKKSRNVYFDNKLVESLLCEYVKDGCTDIKKRDEIMSHASELIRQVIRTHGLHIIYGGNDESSFNDLFQVGWVQIEKTLYKFDHSEKFMLKDGTKLRGMVKNESDNSVTIKSTKGDDADGDIIRFKKSDIKTYKVHGKYLKENNRTVFVESKGGNTVEIDKKYVIDINLKSTGQCEVLRYRRVNDHTKVFNMWCVHPDTMLLTNNGIMKISEVLDQKVYGLNGLANIEAFAAKSSRKTLRFKTELGYKIECTPEHSLYVLGDNGPSWKKASDIKKDDLLGIQYNQQYFVDNNDISDIELVGKGNWCPPTYMTPELAYIIGLFISKGQYFNGNMNINNISDNIVNILINNNLDLNFIYEPYLQRVSICNARFIEFLQKLGFREYVSAKTKMIPQRMLCCSKNILVAMLSGISSIDGYKKGDYIKFSSISKVLIEQIRLLLLNFGILTKLLCVNTSTNPKFVIERTSERTSKGNKIVWLPIRSISNSNSVVCEISVDSEDHSYIANGIISHNSQVAKTVILAYIKKETRDRKNFVSYLDHKNNKRDPKSNILNRFLDEAEDLCKFNSDHLICLEAIREISEESDKPFEGLISKIVERTGLSRIKVADFFKYLRMRNHEFSDAPVNGDDDRYDKFKLLEITSDDIY